MKMFHDCIDMFYRAVYGRPDTSTSVSSDASQWAGAME